jgi:hypothetical protein
VDALRTPRARTTTIGINLRRTRPYNGPWYGALIDNLVVDGIANALGSRSEFQDARVRDYHFGFDYSSTGLRWLGNGA